MKIKTLLLVLISCFTTNLFAQKITQFDRVEINIDDIDDDIDIFPVGKYGALTTWVDAKKRSDDKIEYTFKLYDSDFKEVWEKRMDIDKNLYISRDEFINDKLYIVFKNAKKGLFSILSFDPVKRKLYFESFNVIPKFLIDEFTVLSDRYLYASGTVKKNVVLTLYDLQTKKSSVLPINIKEKITIDNLSLDQKGNQVNVSIIKRLSKKESELVMRSYSGSNLVNELELDGDENILVLTAKISTINQDEKVIVGSYAQNGRYANGIYFSKIENGRIVKMNYYNFTDLKNYFNYLSEKQQARVENKMAKKKSKGKNALINTYLLMHDVEFVNNKYIVVAEVYIPTYRTETYTTYVNGRAVTNSRQVFDGWLFTHTVALAFDENGRLLWDNSLDMGDIKSFVLSEKVRVSFTEKNEIILAYCSSTQIKTTKFVDERPAEKVVEKMRKTDEEDKVKRTISTVEPWYDSNFILYGYQKIKNKEDKTKRSVVYFSKVRVK